MIMKRIVVAFCCMLCGLALCAQSWQYVDPRIGSVGVGRTFPGPCMPFGMVKPGPDCGVLPNAGWAPIPAEVSGFSQTHVSGTGGGQKYGNILIQPLLTQDWEASEQQGRKYYSQHRLSETIELGYYSTTFENGIRTEITTSERCAHYRFHYPVMTPLSSLTASNISLPTSHFSLLIDATHFLGKDSVPDLRERQQFVGAGVEVVSDHEVRGFSRVRGGWNNGDAYTVYFALQTDVPFTAKSSCDDGTVMLGIADSVLNVKVGISYVSTLQAHKNIDSIGFNEQLQRLRNAWEQQLEKIQISGDIKEKRMFYTALYHTMLMPVDKTGENPKWADTPYYDDYYAIWDTYRTSSPLITLLDPQREAAIINSLLNIYRREGYMPDARSGDCNGRTQGGSNADIVIADAFVKNLEGIDYSLALEAMLKDGEADPGDDHEKHGRGGLREYLSLGYVPYGIDRAGNRTVEYAFNDYCIAQVAKGLGKTHIADRYMERSHNWKNLWRSDYEYDGMRGFIMPKDVNGQWLDSVPWGFRNPHSSLTPLSAPSTSHFSIPYTPTTKVAPWYVPWWSTFFYEATSEEYSLSIPHDVEGLIEACGGPDTFYRRLNNFFEKDYYNVQNEPSFLTPCLYHWLGMPNKSTRRIHQIIHQYYSDAPDGLPGNDDSGAMSSWLAFHMMGLYPNAGTDYYLLNVPILRAYTMNLPNGRQLHVSCEGTGSDFVRATLNGRELSDARVTHRELMEGGKLVFKTQMGDLLPPKRPKPILIDCSDPVTPTMTIHYTVNRQFRSWPFGSEWRGDTLIVRCKDTHYIIPRSVVDNADEFCWLSPQNDGVVHKQTSGTFAFISRSALRTLQKCGTMAFDHFTWRKVSEDDATIRVRSDIYDAEMVIDKKASLPFVLEMKHNPLGIDWKITPYEKN